MRKIESRIPAYFYQPLIYIVIGIGIIIALLLPFKGLAVTLKHILFTDSSVVAESNNSVSFVQADAEQNATVYEEDITYPDYQQMFGRITCDNLGLDVYAYCGDGDEILKEGVGTDIGSGLPGTNNKVIIKGKNNLEFSVLQNITPGEIINFATTYGYYTYQVKEIKTVDKDDLSDFNNSANSDQLILYTDYPFTSLNDTSKHFIVSAKRVSGPLVKSKEAQQ